MNHWAGSRNSWIGCSTKMCRCCSHETRWLALRNARGDTLPLFAKLRIVWYT